MPSWVRYSVSAYLGLLISGSIAVTEIEPVGHEPVASLGHDLSPIPVEPAPMLHAPSRYADYDQTQAES